jgi:hypothetical protein
MKRQNEILKRADLALANALRTPEILTALRAYGVDEARIKEIQSQLLSVKEFFRQYREASVEAKAATQALREARDRAQELYSRHVTLGRVALADNPTLLEKMELKGTRKKGLPEWIEQANSFYRHANGQKESLAKYNITDKELNEMQKLLKQLKEMQQLQYQLKARTQVISEQRKKGYDALYRSFSKFIQIARLALDEEPQHLEALGLVVKA